MRIIIYDVAARKGGGGETILKQYFDNAAKQLEHEWWFFVSIKEYQNRSGNNIHVVFVDTYNSSQLRNYYNRIIFERLRLKKIIRDINPDEIISLQNMVVPGVRCKQKVYLHQSFQFSPVVFRFFNKNERSLAFRQRVICKLIKQKLKKADNVIVQTQWMRKAVSKWAHYPENRIEVETPTISMPPISSNIEKKNNTFFYPANAYLNKNHEVLIEACKLLKYKGYTNYKVQFTILPDTNGLTRKLFCETKEEKLPIEFIGYLNKEDLFTKYQTEVMLFPSYIETFGLPLLESKCVGGRIIASSCPFSHEILDNYNEAQFAEWDNPNEWAELMTKYLDTVE